MKRKYKNENDISTEPKKTTTATKNVHNLTDFLVKRLRRKTRKRKREKQEYVPGVNRLRAYSLDHPASAWSLCHESNHSDLLENICPVS